MAYRQPRKDWGIHQRLQLSSTTDVSPQWYFLELCTLHEISCIDPHKRFLRARNRNSLYFLDDGHWSPYGAELAAEIVASHK